MIALAKFVGKWQREFIHIFLLVPFLLLTCQLIKKLIYTNRGPRTNYPPGSGGLLPFLGETLQFLAAIHSKQGFYKFVYDRHLWYGNCFKTHIFGETHVFVSNTESAKEILSNDLGKFTKKYIRSIGEVVGAESLLCASQENHRLIRRQLVDLFSSSYVGEFTKQFDQTVVSNISSWEHRPRVVVLDEALKMSFKAMCKMLLSLECGCELEMLRQDVAYVCQAMLAFPLDFPWTRFSKGLKARKRIMDMLERMIQNRLKITSLVQGSNSHGGRDFLDHLLSRMNDKTCSSNKAPSLTYAHIKDNILSMTIAGQDTTASAMTWMVKYLDENQGVLETLLVELQSVQKNVANRPSLTLDDLNQMTYASKIVKESLRLASIVPWFPRVALSHCKIQGHTIKKGWNINVDARSIHFDQTLYNDPHSFNPSRFDDEPKPYSFLAFGAGGRTCLGMNLAKAMMLVFLYRLVTTYKWKVIDQDSSVEKWALFSRLKSGCPVKITHAHN